MLTGQRVHEMRKTVNYSKHIEREDKENMIEKKTKQNSKYGMVEWGNKKYARMCESPFFSHTIVVSLIDDTSAIHDEDEIYTCSPAQLLS